MEVTDLVLTPLQNCGILCRAIGKPRVMVIGTPLAMSIWRRDSL